MFPANKTNETKEEAKSFVQEEPKAAEEAPKKQKRLPKKH